MRVKVVSYILLINAQRFLYKLCKFICCLNADVKLDHDEGSCEVNKCQCAERGTQRRTGYTIRGGRAKGGLVCGEAWEIHATLGDLLL
jgi:hypothetical protein